MLNIKGLEVELMGETIIENFDFHLNASEVACLYGPSGCGKTTLLRFVSGLIDAEKGRINNQFKRISYLFQEHRLLPWRSAWDNITLISDTVKTENSSLKIKELLKFVDLDESDWHKYPHELSGGMKQRIALIRALMSEPDLLLMDEPFSALDYELKNSLQNLILSRVSQQKMSIILVTHDRHEALRMADKIYLLKEKKPTHCQRIITLNTPYSQRQAAFIEARLKPEFWLPEI